MRAQYCRQPNALSHPLLRTKTHIPTTGDKTRTQHAAPYLFEIVVAVVPTSPYVSEQKTIPDNGVLIPFVVQLRVQFDIYSVFVPGAEHVVPDALSNAHLVAAYTGVTITINMHAIKTVFTLFIFPPKFLVMPKKNGGFFPTLIYWDNITHFLALSRLFYAESKPPFFRYV